MALHGFGTRQIAAVFGVLIATGCQEWDDCYADRCVRVYYPHYGYSWECYPVPVACDGQSQGTSTHRRTRHSGADASANADDASTGPSGVAGSSSVDASGSGAAGHAGMGSAADAAAPASTEAGTTTSTSTAAMDAGAGDAGSSSAASSGTAVATVASGRRLRRFNFSCERDTQCGPGQCINGECFDGCTLDDNCGTADRCSVETGRRICMPDPNPEVRCEASSECNVGQTCVDGACHSPCDVDTDCANPEDRCLHTLCFPDRRPIVECVLNLECATGLVCLDGQCVNLDSWPN
jgi:hypothetical protein